MSGDPKRSTNQPTKLEGNSGVEHSLNQEGDNLTAFVPPSSIVGVRAAESVLAARARLALLDALSGETGGFTSDGARRKLLGEESPMKKQVFTPSNTHGS